MKGLSLTECLLPCEMLMPCTQAHYMIESYKIFACYADLIVMNEDPVERLKLLTTAHMVRQSFSALLTNGMPPIPIPVGSTLTA